MSLEPAATVAELAAAVRRPESTVAHHVSVLVDGVEALAHEFAQRPRSGDTVFGSSAGSALIQPPNPSRVRRCQSRPR